MPKKTQQKDIVKFLFGLWRISPIRSWSMIATQIVFAVLTTTIAPIFVSQLLTGIADGTAALSSSIGLLVGYALVLFIGDVVAFRLTLAMAYFSESKMQSSVAERVLKHLSAKSLGYHANNMSGGTVSDASKLNGSIDRFWDTLVLTAVPIVTTIISVCVVLGFILWQYAIILAVLSLIIILVIIKFQTSISHLGRASAQKSSAMTAYFADVIGNIALVKAFGRESDELKNYQRYINEWRSAILKEGRGVLKITASFGVMMTIMNTCAFVAAILATEYHIASIGATYLVISYTLSVVQQLWSVAGTTRSYVRVLGDAAPMIATLNEHIEIVDVENPQPLIVSDGRIDFDQVNFTHEGNKEKLFSDFCLSIKSGERVGLVGMSGSGKTSLTRILLRFSDITGGKIMIDGQDIAKVSQNDLHNAIAYVSQEPTLFHRTLKENIAYGKMGASEKEISHAAKRANALEFINKLPLGFETLVGERGVKLSGGQRQRIAIARAILKDAPILVLDEATSALDSESEKLIQDALEKLMKDRTSIVIAHRLSTIAKLDRIIVLDDGAIIEQGTHKELLKKKGTYARLWSHQSGGFIEE